MHQLLGHIPVQVAGVGTGGTITGVARYIKARNPNFKAIAVEPKHSPVIGGGKPGKHRIQGIGAGFIPKNLDTSIVDEVVEVDTSVDVAADEAQEAPGGVMPTLMQGPEQEQGLGNQGRFFEQICTACTMGDDGISDPYAAISAIPAATAEQCRDCS